MRRPAPPAAGAATEISPDKLTFPVCQRGRVTQFDMHRYITGRPARRRAPSYRGRVQLTLEFAAVIRSMVEEEGITAHAASGYFHTVLQRHYEFLDRFDKVAPVVSVRDYTNHHGVLWRLWGKHVNYIPDCARLINRARRAQGLPPVRWPPIRRHRRPSRVPQPRDVALIRDELKRRALLIYARWDQGGSECTPRKSEVLVLLWLFLIDTGWNITTALDLDLRGRWYEPDPSDDRLVTLRSFKLRGRTHQKAASDRSETSPFGIVIRLQRITGSNRRALSLQLQDDVFPHQAAADAVSYACGSPWLYRSDMLRALVRGRSDGRSERLLWQGILSDIDAHLKHAGEPVLRRRITPSDFRDFFIGFAYKDSGFQWMAASAAGGHRSYETTNSYLQHIQWREVREDRARDLQDVMWDKIQAGDSSRNEGDKRSGGIS